MTSHLAQANSSAYDSPSYLQSPPPYPSFTRPIPSQKKRNTGPVIDDNDSDVEQLPTPSVNVNATTSGSVSKLSKVILTDAQELKKARQVHAIQKSQCYGHFHPPNLSKATDKNMIAYVCKMCGSTTNRPIYKTSPTNLSKHVANCDKKQRELNANQKLANMGSWEPVILIHERCPSFVLFGARKELDLWHPLEKRLI
ncbi:hypothetical protein PSTG_06221 [Puccinia striiformis f. sp. tritici PST-78]|uniref:BED-type domain-containing protein n=1 Tax=Puccinia striiformis f. sp. tritici PST-78 TaxID=1165861 RepID=A0A0L0VMN0_9BASI|nr:hypothetical protein PSTG_06221 [Puccinia striiformis f. sp. tritici PST-78]